MRVGIDLDGVCYDFAASLHRAIGRTEPFTEPDCWEFYEGWGLSLYDFVEACNQGVDDGIVFSHGAPYPNVCEAFLRIKADGHSIHIITDRSFGTNGGSEAATRSWLDRYNLPFDSLTFTADKTIVNIDAMVDDKLANYDALEECGVDVWLLTRPWNARRDDRRRVLDLLHFAEVIG